MNEYATSGWEGLGTGTGAYAMPSDTSTVASMSGYGGLVQPSSNGYPMFSSSYAGQSSPAGYANANPIDSTPSVIAPQARNVAQGGMPQNPAAPVQAPANPWNINQSSGQGDAMGYPTGKQAALPKISVL